MRESIGSAWLLYLVLTFILVYVFFIAFIMNYASAYRAANYVVTQIENCQGRMDSCNGKNMDAVAKEVASKYHYHSPNNRLIVCYVENGNGTYVFRVNLPVAFDVPLFGNVRWVSVRAETKSIKNVPNVSTITGFSRCS